MSETTNEDRSEWAHTALLAYCSQNRHYEVDLTGEEEFSEVVRDFFADLRHLADTVAGVNQDTLDSWFIGSLEVYKEENAEESAPICVLTGADGENPDDCTTHSHEER